MFQRRLGLETPHKSKRSVHPIAILTDFGNRDPYVGMMKGVMVSISAEALLVDISHEIEPQNLIQARYYLAASYRYFPRGTIFLCVVDPGVGTSRKAVCLKTKDHYFVGPDNGIFGFLQGRGVVVREIENPRFQLLSRKIFSTFHGRDIFAPAAAVLARDGMHAFRRMGRRVRIIKTLDYPHVKKTKDCLKGEILFFDHFGNAITNIMAGDYEQPKRKESCVFVRRRCIGPIQRCYGDGVKGLMAFWNSTGSLEIAKPGGSAKKTGSLLVGDPIMVRF